MIDRLTGLKDRAEAHYRSHHRPLVTLTYAQSLDGSITALPGTQLQISGEETKLLTHQLRSVHDAILVGIGTVLADDPRLTARRTGGPHPQPLILDSHARFPLTAQLLHHPSHQPWIFISERASGQPAEAIEGVGGRVIRLPESEEGYLSLEALLDWLGANQIRSLMVEGGSQVITKFLASQLVDQVILTIAPIFVGGVRGVNNLALQGSFPRLRDLATTQMGEDLVVWGNMRASA